MSNQLKVQQQVAIIGAGAVGRALAYVLRKAEVPFLLYGRHGLISTPFRVDEAGMEQELKVDGDPKRDAALVVFSTKSYDLVDAIREHLPRIPATTPVVFLCNGYIEPLLRPYRHAFPLHTFLKGIVTRGAKFREDGCLVLSQAGAISWGGEGNESELESRLFAAGVGIQRDSEACRNRKIKWYCNTVLNTLAGAYRLSENGQALGHSDYAALNREVFALAQELWPGEFPDAQALQSTLDALIRMTEHNENSMAVDVRLGRRPEIAVLSGVALGVADHESKFPRLMALHRQLER